MWPYLPKKCNCEDSPTNPNYVCDHCGLTTNDFAYTGDDLACTGINNQDDITTSIQKIEEYLCGGGAISDILTQIQNNPEQYASFYELIVVQFNCSIVGECGPQPTTTTTTSSSSTTTTTTTACPCTIHTLIGNKDLGTWFSFVECGNEDFTVENIFDVATDYCIDNSYPVTYIGSSGIDNNTEECCTPTTTTTTTTELLACKNYELTALQNNASWLALNCFEESVGGILPLINDVAETGCILNNSLITSGVTIVDLGECTTTTTTSTSTTTTTSTSTTTTTTTTVAPTTTTTTTTDYPPGTLVVENNTSSTIESVSASGWLFFITTPIAPYTTELGVHANTTAAINVEITAFDEEVNKCLSLYLNNVLQVGSINFTTSGTYAFPAYVISNSTVVKVVLNDGPCVP